MKILFLIFFIFTPLAISADYFDYLLEQEDVDVNCSNVLDFVKEYINLSDKNQNLLVVSANRFLGETEGDNQDPENSEEEGATEEDINQTVYFVQNNQMILSDKASIILEVLPGCLKSEKQPVSK